MEIFFLIIVVILLFFVIRQQLYKDMYNYSSDGISIISNNKVIDCNKKILELFKYDSKKEFLLIHPLKLSPPFQPDGSFSHKKASDMMKEAQKKGNCKFEWVFLTKDEEEKNIEIDIIKLKSRFFFKNRLFMIWRDIDKRIEAEEKLKKLNENLEKVIEHKIKKNKEQERMLFIQSKQAQMGEMLSMIAHQWRQPLTSISSSVIDMKMKIMLESNKEKLIDYISYELEDIEKLTQTLTNIVDDFKDFYKPTKQMSNITITTPINKAYRIIEKSFDYYDITVNFHFDTDSSTFMFESEIVQAILSILQNAKENFLQKNIENKVINISTSEDNNYTNIIICDNGKGIKDKYLDRIFIPYFSTKEKKNGTGLGLYMVSKIIQERHNGIISVKNTDDGVCFTISLKKGNDFE